MFSQCKLSLSVVLLLLSCNSSADNVINIYGSGGKSEININASAATNSEINIYQVGDVTSQSSPNKVTIHQSGSNQQINIGQGASYNGSSWTPEASVHNNQAEITQNNSNEQLTINQNGSGNQATVTQTGEALQALIQQTTSDSTLTVNQTASTVLALSVHDTSINAAGSYLEVTQNATNTVTKLNASIEVTQSGAGNTADISGMTGGTAKITQSGTSQVTLNNQSDGRLDITQSGGSNSLTIQNYNLDKTLIISQTGGSTTNWGGATTVDYGGPSYTPSMPTPEPVPSP